MEDYAADDAMGLGAIWAFATAFFVVGIVLYLIVGFCLGKVFEKAGKPLWAGFVPIYNIIIVTEITGRPMWWAIIIAVGCFLGWIPFLGWLFIVPALVFISALYIDFTKSFGKDSLWASLTMIFPYVMIPVMAFSTDIRYIGPAAAPAASTGSGGSMM